MGDRQETVLILNGSHAEIPLIEAAKALGYRVVTTGADPSGLGHPYADDYVPADFSDVDAILGVAKDEDVSGIIAGCNDFAAITASHVADALGLPGHDRPETCIRLHHKDKFRATMRGLGLPSIRAVRVAASEVASEAVSDLNMPVIVKPVDLTGGKGMTVCERVEEVATAVETALNWSRAGHVVIEEYLKGSHHGFTCFIESGKVVWWFADDEQYFLNPFLVAGTSTPSSLPSSAITDIINSVEVIAAALALADGLVHIQCVLTREGPLIIELCRRCPGDLYPEFVSISTGHDYATQIVRSELGLPPEIPEDAPEPTPTVRYCAMPATDGIFRELVISPRVDRNVSRTWPLMEPGAPIKDHLTQKQAIIFLRFPDSLEVTQHLHLRNSDIQVLVEGW
jgi:biotin carboxylase